VLAELLGVAAGVLDDVAERSFWKKRKASSELSKFLEQRKCGSISCFPTFSS